MGLSRKTFLYSISMAVFMVIFILGYFVLMLPSLYVNQMKKDNLESVVNVQRGYMKERNYKNLTVKNPTGAATLEIPMQGNQMYLAGKAFKVTLKIKDRELMGELEKLRAYSADAENMKSLDDVGLDMDLFKRKVMRSKEIAKSFPVDFKVRTEDSTEVFGEKGTMKAHMISKNLVVYEGSIADKDNEYLTYIAVGKTDDALIISFLPVMAPQMHEMKPIVLESLPMITAVIFLIVLIASQIFSRKIIQPVIRLAKYAEDVRESANMDFQPLEIKEKDEIGDLGRTFNALYEELQKNYRKLEAENKRQEVFLRASSHQLKTPITAALLLTEGMINEVGKYKERDIYLPEVKKQLLSMRKIVEDILYLNHCKEHMQKVWVDLCGIVRSVLLSYQVQITEKMQTVRQKDDELFVRTDGEIMRMIIDNLISNAVSYTPADGEIEVRYKEREVIIINSGTTIDEEILPHVYEPFVSSERKEKGKGLGLYVASYYAEILGWKLEVSNTESGVMARLYEKKAGEKNVVEGQ